MLRCIAGWAEGLRILSWSYFPIRSKVHSEWRPKADQSGAALDPVLIVLTLGSDRNPSQGKQIMDFTTAIFNIFDHDENFKEISHYLAIQKDVSASV
jgi:hypothetical protein